MATRSSTVLRCVFLVLGGVTFRDSGRYVWIIRLFLKSDLWGLREVRLDLCIVEKLHCGQNNRTKLMKH